MRTESLGGSESERIEEPELGEVQGEVLEESGNEYDEQVAVRHADASGGHIMENHHEKRRTRDIQVSGAVQASSRPCSTIHEPRKARE